MKLSKASNSQDMQEHQKQLLTIVLDLKPELEARTQ
jgi:hypothetical protein